MICLQTFLQNNSALFVIYQPRVCQRSPSIVMCAKDKTSHNGFPTQQSSNPGYHGNGLFCFRGVYCRLDHDCCMLILLQVWLRCWLQQHKRAASIFMIHPNPYNAEILLHKPWIYQFENIINVWFSSFRVIWILNTYVMGLRSLYIF